MEQEVDSIVPWNSYTQFECNNSSCYIRESVIPSLTWSLMIKAYMVSFLLLVSIVVWTAGDACFQYGRSYWEYSTTSTLFSSYTNYTNLIHEYGWPINSCWTPYNNLLVGWFLVKYSAFSWSCQEICYKLWMDGLLINSGDLCTWLCVSCWISHTASATWSAQRS